MKPLTRIQEDVYGIVAEEGPLTVRDLVYHLPIEESRARSVLNQLEDCGLVGRNYTCHRTPGTHFAYEVPR